ncbi:MAG: dATP/dGTP diphosphohydrolase domain-containing protein [Myxococcota bacterium]
MSPPPKPKPSLLPTDALYAVMRVLEKKGGTRLEGPRELGPEDVTLEVDAAIRHLLEHNAGREMDPDTEELQLACAAASALTALELAFLHRRKRAESLAEALVRALEAAR